MHFLDHHTEPLVHHILWMTFAAHCNRRQDLLCRMAVIRKVARCRCKKAQDMVGYCRILYERVRTLKPTDEIHAKVENKNQMAYHGAVEAVSRRQTWEGIWRVNPPWPEGLPRSSLPLRNVRQHFLVIRIRPK